MTNQKDNSGLDELMEHLIASGPEAIGRVFARAMEQAMQFERERFLGAQLYERAPDRRGYANGYKPKRLDTVAGSLVVNVPKTAGHDDQPFFPESLERGRRSTRAVLLAVAQMYIQGVSTRDAERVMAEFGLTSLSSTQVSRAAKLLDDELEAWRTRAIGEVRYLMLDARYEKCRQGGIVSDCAVLTAIGIGPDERRRVLGVSVARSEAEIHWREFLESLTKRGLRGVQFITSDDHAGLGAARKAVFGGTTWQRCQFHLAQNAIQHAPTLAIRKTIGSELRDVWNARTLTAAQEVLNVLVASYRDQAPKFADWLQANIPQGLAVFKLPASHQRRMRTSNPMERAIQQELKRRTQKVRVFPSEGSLLRLVSAVLVEIDDKWAADNKGYIKWDDEDGSDS